MNANAPELASLTPDYDIETRRRQLRAEADHLDREVTNYAMLHGQGWAMNRHGGGASALQMERLDAARDPKLDWGFGVGESAYTAGEEFYFIIEPEKDGDREAANEFWNVVGGIDSDRRRHSATYVHHFAVGVMYAMAELSDGR
jgi:hypothetical protein